MNRRYIILYIVIPIVVVFPMILAGASGIGWLQDLIAVRNAQEFGILENLQNLVLILALLLLLQQAFRHTDKREKAFLLMLAGGTLFLFLEEIDYGLHHYEYLRGIPPEEWREVRNIHNRGADSGVHLTARLKLVCDLGLAFICIILPLCRSKFRNRWFLYLTPPHFYFAASLVVMVLLSKTAHVLRYFAGNTWQIMRGNTSEFRELIIYYLFLLYIYELTHTRRLSDATRDSQSREPGNRLDETASTIR